MQQFIIWVFTFTWLLLGHLVPPVVLASESTHPPRESLRPLGEWEGRRRLVLVLTADPPHSLEGVSGLGSIREAYFSVIKAVLPVVNVTVITPSGVDALDFAKWVQEEGLSESLRTGHLALETFAVDSIWIRDYGVLLARGETTGSLYGIDPVYAQHAADQKRFYDDRMAYWLFRKEPIRWIRPTLSLDGGNFETDGKGTCFTSTETLGYNRASAADVADAFRRWMGCRETIILEPIPVESTGHLDMFFKVLSPDIWLLGQYFPRQKPVEPLDHLEYLAHLAMEKNATTLRSILKKRGRGRLVRIGMPRPHTFDYYDWDPTEWDLPRKRQQPVATLGREKHYRTEVGFANYVNTVYVRGARGEAVIIPSYATDEFDAAAVSIYREAYPKAKVIRMPSDYLIQERGAVHCVLYTIPE